MTILLVTAVEPHGHPGPRALRAPAPMQLTASTLVLPIRSPDANYDLPETCVSGARFERDGVVVAATQNTFTQTSR